MRRAVLLIAVLLVTALLSSDSPKDYDGSMTEDGLEGTWRLAKFERSGVKASVSDKHLRVFHNCFFQITTMVVSPSVVLLAF